MLGALVGLLVAWAVMSIAQVPPLDAPPPAREAVVLLDALGVVAIGLYIVAAIRLARLSGQRGGVLVPAIAVATVLLAEALLAVMVSRNWHASWWEWHVLLLSAIIALGARYDYRRGGTLTSAFGGLYLEATLRSVDRWYAAAVAAVVSAEARGSSAEAVLAELKSEGATDSELALLGRTANEVQRLDAAFRPYLPSVVTDVIRRGSSAALPVGGEERDVSVLFADLAAFTTFSETRSPSEVIAMLNAYWAAVVPVVDAGGGVIEQFAGDGEGNGDFQRSRRPAGPRPARGADGSGPRGRRPSACRRASGLARVPGRDQQRTSGAGRWAGRTTELRGDRRHDEHRSSAHGCRRAGRCRRGAPNLGCPRLGSRWRLPRGGAGEGPSRAGRGVAPSAPAMTPILACGSSLSARCAFEGRFGTTPMPARTRPGQIRATARAPGCRAGRPWSCLNSPGRAADGLEHHDRGLTRPTCGEAVDIPVAGVRTHRCP